MSGGNEASGPDESEVHAPVSSQIVMKMRITQRVVLAQGPFPSE
jgi:hypothetical protein